MKKIIFLFIAVASSLIAIAQSGITHRSSGSVNVSLDFGTTKLESDTLEGIVIIGDVTGDLFGNVTGSVWTGSLDVSGNVSGTNFYGVTFIGDLTGGVTGNVSGSLYGNVTGDINANIIIGDSIYGNWFGGAGRNTAEFIGNVTGDVTGNVTGNVIGDLTGDVTGDIIGDVDADTVYCSVLGQTGGNLAIDSDTITSAPIWKGQFRVGNYFNIATTGNVAIGSTTSAYKLSVFGNGMIRDTIATTRVQALTSGGTAGLLYLGRTTDKITIIGDTMTDGTAQWSSNLLKGFTSVSAGTLTDGTASISAGAISGVTTLTTNKVKVADSIAFKKCRIFEFRDTMVSVHGVDICRFAPPR